MLTTIDSPICNWALVCLDNRESHGFYKALDVVLHSYNTADYRIKSIHCDNEFAMMVESVQDDLDIKITCVPQEDHVPEAKCNNRTIGKRIRAAFSLPAISDDPQSHDARSS